MKKGIILAALLVGSISAFAQNKDSVFRNLELPAAVIQKTSKTTETKIENSAVILTKKNIQKLNTAVDVPYILNQTPSTVVGSDAGIGVGYTNIRIRGTDISRINVNMNGIPINDAEGQGVFFVNFPDILGSANSLSIERGVGTSKAGYGNFGGAISINNLDVDYKKPHVSIMSDYASFNTFKNSFKVSTGLINNRFITTARLSKITSDGYIQRSGSNLSSAQITSKYYITPNTTLTFNYLGGKEKTGQAWNGVWEENLDTARTFNELGAKSDGTFYDNQTDNYQQDYYQLFFDRLVKNIDKKDGALRFGGAAFYTKGKGYYEEYKLQQSYASYGLNDFVQGADTSSSTDLIRQLWLDNDYYGIRAYVSYFGKKIKAGLYFNSSRYVGDHFGDVIWAQKGIANDYRWYENRATKNDQNIYGMFSYQLLKNLQFFADVQYRNVNYEINGFRDFPAVTHDLTWNFVNPKVELRYAPSRNTSLAFFAARSSKEPNRGDFETSTLQLPRPEQLTDLELTYNQRLAKGLKLYTTFYYMLYKDQLILTGQINDVGAYARTNSPDSYRRGVEIVATYELNKRILLQGNISLSENKQETFTEYMDDYDAGGQLAKNYKNTDLAFSPSVIAGGQLTFYPLRNGQKNMVSEASLDIIPKYVGRQYLDNTQNIDRSIKPFSTTDVLVNLPLKLEKGGTFKFRAGLLNVFNNLYESNGYTFSFISGGRQQTYNYYYPQAGLRYTIGVGFEF